jgi:hypothetical protein
MSPAAEPDRSRLFVGNFDFEHHLNAAPAREGVQQIAAALASVWVAISERADWILSTEPLDRSDFAALEEFGSPLPQFVTSLDEVPAGDRVELVPWGWTADLAELGRSHGWHCSAPPQHCVRTANSRSFRLALESEWQVGLPGAAEVRSLEELSRIITRSDTASRGWVLKANFGMSARERLLGRGTSLTPQTLNWAQRRLAAQGVLIFEPWVERLAEAGLQLTIPPAGEPRLLGITALLTDRTGVYRGSRFNDGSADDARWAEAAEVALRVARRLQQLGYFGPLGIDAMLYRDPSGKERLRPLQDLNARYTMGRLSLGFRRLLRAGQAGSWLHFPWSGPESLQAWLAEFSRTVPADVQLVPTSPSAREDRPLVRASVLLVASTPEVRDDVESRLLATLPRRK